MATVTPTYSWPVPTSTDYVADGAVAIEALGDAIDATVSTALGGAYPGLKLIKKQAIGSGVSSVVVSSAFSSTFNNYLVIFDNFTSSNAGNSMSLQMRAGGTTNTAGYYGVLAYWNYVGSPGAAANNNVTNWGNVGRTLGVSQKTTFAFNLLQPFLADRTLVASLGTTGFDISGQYTGWHDSAVSYDGFVVSFGGTITGGNVFVYGYGMS